MNARLRTPFTLCAALLAVTACEKVDDGLDGGDTEVYVTTNEDGDQFFSRVHSRYESPVDIEVGFDFENEAGIRILNRSIEFKAVKPDQEAQDVNGMYVDIDYACFTAYAIVTPIGSGSAEAEELEVDAEGRTCN